VRQRIASMVTDERLLEWVRDRFVAGLLCDGNPVAGSMLKLAAGTLEQRCAELIFEINGAAAQAWLPSDGDGDISSHSLNATRQATIAGGTHQIQRNLLGERVLGLPRERAALLSGRRYRPADTVTGLSASLRPMV
jgi:alkylation response protein AidB-like acyl-CoA dehydrogenase